MTSSSTKAANKIAESELSTTLLRPLCYLLTFESMSKTVPDEERDKIFKELKEQNRANAVNFFFLPFFSCFVLFFLNKAFIFVFVFLVCSHVLLTLLQYCAECGAANPQWASIPLGISICYHCSGIHRRLLFFVLQEF